MTTYEVHAKSDKRTPITRRGVFGSRENARVLVDELKETGAIDVLILRDGFQIVYGWRKPEEAA